MGVWELGRLHPHSHTPTLPYSHTPTPPHNLSRQHLLQFLVTHALELLGLVAFG